MEDKDKDKRIPDKPPFTAYIANLPYDVDEGEVKEVFEKAKLRIKNVRLIKDKRGFLKGFGFADFADRDSLVEVLTMDLSVKNRKMRMNLASQAGKNRPKRGGFDNEGRGNKDDDRRGDGSDGRDGEDGAKEVDAALKSLSVSKDRGRIVAESRLKL